MTRTSVRVLLILATLLAVCLVTGQSYRALNDRIKNDDDATAVAVLSESVPEDSDLSEMVADLAESKDGLSEIRSIVASRAAAEGASGIDRSWASKARSTKKSNPLYRDDDKEKQGGNWLAKAYEKLGEALQKLLNRNGPDLPNIRPSAPFFGSWLIYLMWGVLGLALAACLYLAIRHFSWKAKLKRKATSLLGEDEPERSLDEWLNLADQYEREGKYREAVRSLYLACLLKFDEYRVARFDRGQTNWEHLERIRSSPKMPTGLDFLAPTRAFDRVWYGMIVEGKPDVDRFRNWYEAVVDSLRGATS